MPKNVTSKLQKMKTLNRSHGWHAKTSLHSDSVASFITPWQKNRAPPIYPNAQTGRIIRITEFWLFYVAVTLLIVSLGLIALSLWSLRFKILYQFFDTSNDLVYFAIPVYVLCLSASWITLSVHNDPKSRKFLSLVLTLLTFSIVVTVIAVYFGFTHKLQLKVGEIESDPVLAEFRLHMRRSMEYGTEGKVWDDIQTTWSCCGVDNYTDWFPILHKIPESCCHKQTPCLEDNSTSPGCLLPITVTLALQTCIFSGLNCVALFLQCCAFLIVAVILFSGKPMDED